MFKSKLQLSYHVLKYSKSEFQIDQLKRRNFSKRSSHICYFWTSWNCTDLSCVTMFWILSSTCSKTSATRILFDIYWGCLGTSTILSNDLFACTTEIYRVYECPQILLCSDIRGLLSIFSNIWQNGAIRLNLRNSSSSALNVKSGVERTSQQDIVSQPFLFDNKQQ